MAPEPASGPHGTPSILTQPEWREYVGTFTPGITPEPNASYVPAENTKSSASNRDEFQTLQTHRQNCSTAPARLTLPGESVNVTESQKNLDTNFFITEIRNEDKVKEMVIPLAKSIKRELLHFPSNQVRWRIIDVSFNFFQGWKSEKSANGSIHNRQKSNIATLCYSK